MANDVAWIDVLPSMKSFMPAIDRALAVGMPGAGRQAGEQFGQGFQKSAADAVAKVSATLTTARNREADAAGKLRVAEQKLQELRESGRATTSQLVAAEERLSSAQRTLADRMEATETSARKLADAKERAANESRGFSDSLADVEKKAGLTERGMDKVKGSVGGLVAGMGAAGGVLAAFWGNLSNEVGQDKLAASLDISATQAHLVGAASARIYRDAWGDSMEHVQSAVGIVMSSIKGMRDASVPDIERITKKALDFAKAFEVDMARAVQVAGTMINSGLAADADQAFDLLVSSSQRVPVALREDLLDATEEYGQFFTALGYTGEETMDALVAASDKGIYGIDKMGDAVKEFTIRATDGSKASAEAYEKIGLGAEEMSNQILAGGDTAQEATRKIIDGLLGIEDPSERANAAIALFGTPLEDLNVTEIPSFLEGMKGMTGGLGEVKGSADRMSATLNDNFATKVETWKRQAMGFAQDGLMSIYYGFIDGARSSDGWRGAVESVGVIIGDVWGVLRSFGSVLDEHIWIVYSVTGALAAWKLAQVAVAVSTTAMSAAQFISTASTYGLSYALTAGGTAARLYAAGQWLANTALLGFPLVWVVAAFGAVAAGLYMLWTRSETFRDVVTSVWSAVQSGISVAWESGIKPVFGFFISYWRTVGEGIAWGWTNLIRPAWSAVQDGASFLWRNVLLPVFEAIGTGWSALASGLDWAWQNIIRPAWNLLSTVAKALAVTLAVVVFGPILLGWEVMSAGIRWAWQNIIEPAWNATAAGARWLWERALRPVFGFVGDAWNALARGLDWVWMNIIRPVWSAVESGARWLWDRVLRPVFDSIAAGWRILSDGLRRVYDSYIAPVFDAFGRLVNTIRDGFRTGVDHIGRIWDELKAKLRAPVQWVVDVVWNDGLRRLWNTINNLWGGEDLGTFRFATGGVYDPTAARSRANGQGAYATGGVLPGYTPGRDVHSFISPTGGRLELSGGEAVMRPEWTRVLGKPTIDHWNQLARTQGEAGLRRALGEHVPTSRDEHAHFASGGIIDLPGWLDTALKFVPGGGFIGGAIDRINGGAGFGGGLFGRGLAEMVRTIGGKLWEAAKGLFGSVGTDSSSSSPAAVGKGPVGGTWHSLWNAVKAIIPQARINSTYRPGDPGYHGRNKAIDFGFGTGPGGLGSPGLASIKRVLHDRFGGNLAELIYNGAGNDRNNLKNSRPLAYSRATQLQHRNHVHAAVYRLGGILPSWSGNLIPMFHGGGVVADHGRMDVPAFLASNERVLAPEQDNYFRRFVDVTSEVLGGAGGGDRMLAKEINVYAQDPDQGRWIVDDLWHKVRVADRGGVFAFED